MKSLLYILISNLLATTVSVQSLNSSDMDYENHILQSKDRVNYTTYYRQQNTHLPEMDRLLRKAQFEFLKGSLDESKILFKKVSQLEHEKIWSQKERKKIHYAFFRWAQLTPDPVEKEKIIKTALIFDDQQIPDAQLFPPPLVNLFSKLKKESAVQVWALPENSEKFDQILINGIALTGRSGFIRKTKGIRKVTFLSNKYQPLDVKTAMENLETLKISLTPLASGDCNAPLFPKIKESHPPFELYDPQCQQHGLNLASQKLSVPEYKNRSVHQKKSSLFKNKWFWIGASVLVGGLILHQVNENQSHSNGNQSRSNSQESPPPAIYSN